MVTSVDQSKKLQSRLVKLLAEFEKNLDGSDLRAKVRSLVPVFKTLRKLGASLVDADGQDAAKTRLLLYLRKYPKQIIAGDELMVVSGIGEWARRVRELRVQQGWNIASGQMLNQMRSEDPDSFASIAELVSDMPDQLKADQYVLLAEDYDRDAAFRWNMLNSIRKESTSVKDKILKFLRANVGKRITGEELRYLAKDSKEWARRIRELRTEEGWPVRTRTSGSPDLPVGVYVLESDKQAPRHDRKIPDSVRARVLERDHFSCTCCGWKPGMANPADPRTILELHHVKEHVVGGENTVENLRTLCNVCHDDVHAKRLSWDASTTSWRRTS